MLFYFFRCPSQDIELNGTVVHSVDMKKTEAKFCLTKVGEYNLVPKSCHKFKNSDKLVFNTDTPKPVLLTAVAHQVRLQLVTADHEAAPSKILATVAAGQSGEGKLPAFKFLIETATTVSVAFYGV